LGCADTAVYVVAPSVRWAAIGRRSLCETDRPLIPNRAAYSPTLGRNGIGEQNVAAIHRRQVLGMIGGGAVAAGCTAQPLQPEARLDLSDVGSRVRAYVKASARLDPGRSIWSTRAEVHAVLPSGEVRPVVRVKGCEQQWIRPLSSDSFVSFDNLVTYYCDFDTDQVIREYRNSFTQATNVVKPFVSRMPEGRDISPQGVMFRVMRQAYPAFYRDSSFDLLIRQVGDNISFQGEAKWPPEFIRPPAGSRLTTFAPLGELADPARSSVSANFAGYVLMPYFPWMQMGDHPGHLLWHVQGYKVESLSSLPKDYLAAAAEDFGDRFEQSPEFDTEPSGFAKRLRAMGRLP